MKLASESFTHNEPIPKRCAFAEQDPDKHIRLGQNLSPQLSWSEMPAGTRSLALICTDPDVPSSMEDFNQEGRTIPAALPRVDFIHWVMVDIPATEGSVAEGECSDGITPGGKHNLNGPAGSRQGINDYTAFFAADEDMQGNYFGYEGPCPPWNDEILHHYHFTLFALDIDKCPVGGAFTAADVLAAIQGHILAKTELAGTYSLNPDVN
ncbi:MAG: YbhB/YbcL family Raf kinase inhibitor-like protein [Gammaproteobacteria bacterium]|nr:MAG: YbhB/YbcL family Raf kinase inhibitor-like protein [Gammaproteobacteria bacterium]